MSRFIESLESRRLLSASASTLTSDLTAIGTDAGGVKSSFLALEAALIGDFTSIKADLKGTGKSSGSELGALRSAGLKAFSKLKSDGLALLKVGTTAKRATADGIKLIAKSSTAQTNKVTKDVAALGSGTTTPLANIQADSAETAVVTQLTAITTANPSNSTLATDVAKAKSDISTHGSSYASAAQTFANAVATLKTDLGTLV